MAWQQTGDAALKQVLTLFNHRPTWSQAKPPNQTVTVRAHIRVFGGEEIELINAYGANGVAIYIDADSIPVPPEKFDTFTLDGRRYVTGGVHKRYGFNNTLLYYEVHSRGADG